MLPLFEKARRLRLTETEKTILAYFEAHPAAVVHMNLSDLCAQLYTSNATIVRFCQKLELSGFNDFKYQLRSELRDSRAAAFYADEYISHSIARFQDTIAALDIPLLEEIARLLTSGRPLYIYGTNLSALPARYLQIVLNSLDYPSILIEWGDLLNGLVRNMDSRAVLLVITARGRGERYLEPFRSAKARGLTTVLLTSERRSPLIPYSTITVCTNDLQEYYQRTDVNPRIGFFTVIQILIELTAQRKREAAETAEMPETTEAGGNRNQADPPPGVKNYTIFGTVGLTAYPRLPVAYSATTGSSSSMRMTMTSEQSFFDSMNFREKRRIGSPSLILSPSALTCSKPSPLSPTVSTPTWMSTSWPLSLRRPMACLLSSEQWVMTPLQGATITSAVGQMTTPSPRIRLAKFSSLASVMGRTLPATGAFSSSFWAGVFLAVLAGASAAAAAGIFSINALAAGGSGSCWRQQCSPRRPGRRGTGRAAPESGPSRVHI